jgi:TM2 domain-containing membrane protein YozV
MSMQLPNLPTDNLYKFISLSGLTIFIFSFFIPFYFDYSINLKVADIQSDVHVLENKLIMLENTPKDSPHFDRRAQESEVLIFKARKANELAKHLRLNQLEILHYKYLGISIGVILSLLGFYLWYTRVQKYLDKELKNNSEN